MIGFILKILGIVFIFVLGIAVGIGVVLYELKVYFPDVYEQIPVKKK